jgi:hypothetical protein
MQKDFNLYSTPLLIGQRADTSLSQIDSYGAEADIKFGAAVKRGTKKDRQCLPLDDADDFLGIALRDDLQRTNLLKSASMISVMTKGRVVVQTSEAVVAGDKAYVHAGGVINKSKEDGLEIGVFMSSQAEDNKLVILEVK